MTPVSEYQSIGIGTYLANYLYERLNPSVGFTYNSPPERMAHLGVFILQQVKSKRQSKHRVDECELCRLLTLSGPSCWGEGCQTMQAHAC